MIGAMDAETYARLAHRFSWFATEARGSSPLYEQLSLAIAADPEPELLELASVARPGQPLPNLLFAAAHLRLLDGVSHPLADYYPSVGGSRPPDAGAYPHFRAFCLAQRAAIVPLLQEGRVQTNEVRRCALLLPAFGLAARLGGGRPLALIEIGASAGLNLLWDRYAYRYSDGRKLGDPHSPVRLSCVAEGDPPLPAALPAVACRVGVDLNPLDSNDVEQRRWLRALVWPEQAERAALLEAALAVARCDPPRMVAGDALAALPALLAELPPGTTPCVYHSQTVNQFSDDARVALRALLDGYGQQRDFAHISIEAERADEHPALRLAFYGGGVRTEQLLARCHAHGGWLRWLDPAGW